MTDCDLILFDWDGTLVHSMPSIEHTTRRTFEEAGLPAVSPQVMNDAIRDGRGLEYYLHILQPDLPEAELPALMRDWRAMYEAESHPYTKPFPGTADMLARLGEAGVALAVFSNKGEPALRRSARDQGLADHFQLLVGDLDGQPKKPHAEAFHQRVAPHFPGLDPARVLMVGDAESDLRFGHGFGGMTCLATYGYGDMATCNDLGPDLIIDNVTELADKLLAGTKG